MPARLEKQRRRAIVKALRVVEHAAAEAARPLEKRVLRELLPYLEDALLIRATDGSILTPCDHTLKLTENFLRSRELWSNDLPKWFAEYGGFCDCEVMYNVFDYWDNDRLRES